MNPDRARWNEKHRKGGHTLPSIPLLLYQGRLTKGRLLDVAGGRGENAAILALAGWRVLTMDLSDEAVRLARFRSRELKADVQVVQADALRLPFRGPFETVVVTRFLERSLAGELASLLAPGGTILCEQSLEGRAENYCVKPGELAGLFPSFEVLVDTVHDGRSVFVGRKKNRD